MNMWDSIKRVLKSITIEWMCNRIKKVLKNDHLSVPDCRPKHLMEQVIYQESQKDEFIIWKNCAQKHLSIIFGFSSSIAKLLQNKTMEVVCTSESIQKVNSDLIKWK